MMLQFIAYFNFKMLNTNENSRHYKQLFSKKYIESIDKWEKLLKLETKLKVHIGIKI